MTMTASLSVIAGSLVMLAMLPDDPTYLDVVPALVLLGATGDVARSSAVAGTTPIRVVAPEGERLGIAQSFLELGGEFVNTHGNSEKLIELIDN